MLRYYDWDGPALPGFDSVGFKLNSHDKCIGTKTDFNAQFEVPGKSGQTRSRPREVQLTEKLFKR